MLKKKTAKTSSEIEAARLAQVQAGATLSVGNLLVSIGVGFDSQLSVEPR